MSRYLLVLLLIVASIVTTSAKANTTQRFDKVITIDDLSMQQLETLQRIYDYFQDNPAEAVMMAKVGFCESSLEHVDPETGRVKINVNTNGTIDRGLFQINSVHNDTLAELALDVRDENDNLVYAEQLFIWRSKRYTDWNSSKDCWSVLILPNPTEVTQALTQIN